MIDFFITSKEMLLSAAPYIALAVIAVGILQSTIYAVQILIASTALSNNGATESTGHLWENTSAINVPVSILMPTYREPDIVQAVRSVLSLEYPNFELVVTVDGELETLNRLIEAFSLEKVNRAYQEIVPHEPIVTIYASKDYPDLTVALKGYGRKSDTLNAALNLSRNPYFCVVDADSILEKEALLRAVQPLIHRPEQVVGIGGTVRVANDCPRRHGRLSEAVVPKSTLCRIQALEYLRAFLVGRMSWGSNETTMLVSGAFGIFRRDVAMQAGGYDLNSLGEDFEIVMRIHDTMRRENREYRIDFVPEPVCWTEVPDNLSALWRQRVRWQRGCVETLWKFKHMLFNRRYQRIGTTGMLQLIIADIIGPLVELLGYLVLPIFIFAGQLDIEYFIAFVLLQVSFSVMFSLSAVSLEGWSLQRYFGVRSLLSLTSAAFIETVGYRQFCNLARVAGMFHSLIKSPLTWHAQRNYRAVPSQTKNELSQVASSG